VTRLEKGWRGTLNPLLFAIAHSKLSCGEQYGRLLLKGEQTAQLFSLRGTLKLKRAPGELASPGALERHVLK
jgi:hypothetical protein